MNITRLTHGNSLRAGIAFLFLALTAVLVFMTPARAEHGYYKRVKATDSCRDIREVRIRSGWWIDSIQLVCATGMKPRRGGNGGGLHVFHLQPGEFITGLSGRRNGLAGDYVYALQIHTNLRSSPVYGQAGHDRGSKAFHLRVPGGHFVTGVETHAGRFLEKIRLKTGRIRHLATHNGLIHHDCRNIAEVRVRQTPWGSEIEVRCVRGRQSWRGNSRDWKTFYRHSSPGQFDGRFIARNTKPTRKPRHSFVRRH